jgi:hypothetical protein
MATAAPIVIKAADRPEPELQVVSAFQVGKAKVESQNAFKLLEFYCGAVADADFKKFFREKVSELNAQVELQLATDKI